MTAFIFIGPTEVMTDRLPGFWFDTMCRPTTTNTCHVFFYHRREEAVDHQRLFTELPIFLHVTEKLNGDEENKERAEIKTKSNDDAVECAWVGERQGVCVPQQISEKMFDSILRCAVCVPNVCHRAYDCASALTGEHVCSVWADRTSV